MSSGILGAEYDARASIEVKSPAKDAAALKGISLTLDTIQDSPAGGSAPSPLSSERSGSALGQSMEMPNQALISRLLESLESLKTKGSQHSSGATSPSPLAGSADRVPSSPTEVIRYDFSPGDTISREHSTDCLAAAVQALTLNQQQQHGLPHHHQRQGYISPHSSASKTTQQMPWNVSNHRIPSSNTSPHHIPVNNHYAAYSNSSSAGITTGNNHHHRVVHHQPLATPGPYTTAGATNVAATGMIHTAAAATAQQTCIPQASFFGGAGVALPQAATANPMAAFAAYHALVGGGQLGGPHPGLIRPAFSPQPLLEECLVGLEGAYQPYCRQVISEELNQAALRMLSNLKNIQLADPPALTRIIGKRYFCSLKEVSKVVHGARMLIVAPDVRPSATAHIKPVRLLQMVLAAADAAGVPYVFALSRRGIGQVFGRDKSMSIVAVMQLDQVEGEYLTLLEQATAGRELYALHRNPVAASVRRY